MTIKRKKNIKRSEIKYGKNYIKGDAKMENGKGR